MKNIVESITCNVDAKYPNENINATWYMISGSIFLYAAFPAHSEEGSLNTNSFTNPKIPIPTNAVVHNETIVISAAKAFGIS